MSPEFLARIFEPFTQESPGARSSYEGTGLGMSIAKKLVDAMGGTIEVSSRVGEGSTFQITIPFEVAQAPDVRAARGLGGHRPGPRRKEGECARPDLGLHRAFGGDLGHPRRHRYPP